MAQLPPDSPPPQFVAYPRASAYGDAEKLQKLSDGYFGLNKVFLINLVLAFAARGGSAAVPSESAWLYVVFVVVAMSLIIGFLTFPHNKKIGEGAGWSSAGPVVASVLMGINSALCCGIIGYVVVQQIASTEMKKFGVRGGFFGIKKKEVQQLIEQMRAQQGTPPPYNV